MRQESREYTSEEITTLFMSYVWSTIHYWAKVRADGKMMQEGEVDTRTVEDRLEGLAFSLLNILDGTSIGICGFICIPSVHPDDKQYCIAHGENYFPDNDPAVIELLRGVLDYPLHEMFYAYQRQNRSENKE